MKTALYNALVNNRELHPERMNATADRIREVLNIVCPEKARVILDQYLNPKEPRPAKNALDNSNGPDCLSAAQAGTLARGILREVPPNRVKQIVSLLNNSKISTSEAIELHEKFKIPVSPLEKDLVFVRAQGAWFYDTLSNKYLDMDSNYSATNLGNENKEIAVGLFNQASQLIATKEDRVHIPRTRFLNTIHSMMPKDLTQFYW